MALILSPFPNLHHDADDARHSRDHDGEEASRLTLSRYSSSRGSNSSFPAGDKKPGRRRQVLRVLSGRSSGGGDDADGEAQRSGAWRYVKLDPEAPCCCIAFQVAWRVAASAALALLVFVLATRPRHPGVTFRVGRVQRFALGEGLDGSGVETIFLNCNSSVDMVVENHSKVFTLRVRPPRLEMSFGRFVFAASQGDGGAPHDVGPRGTSTVRLFVAAREKPMYAAGRAHAGPARVQPRPAAHHHGQGAVPVPSGGEPGQAHVPPRLPVRRAPQEDARPEQRHRRRRRQGHLLRRKLARARVFRLIPYYQDRVQEQSNRDF
ncbi:hypothetical protein PVAP13_9KG621100 [Panicum virgatum]|uniref:Uncharacterized protein n=1 Tax=Panicum virgatum TaxID=38727 RepID=A0A8T0P379_PANVG|nr:hypothetical protein PVAP13_9KG621100 [Panicum virgatum]